MQLKLINAVLCSKVIRDAENNSINLMGVLENITLAAKEFPETITIPTSFEIFTHWMREDIQIPYEGSFRINYLMPGGESHQLIEMKIDLLTHSFHRAIIKIAGIKLHGPGLYGFQIEQKTDDGYQALYTIPLLVTFSLESPEEIKA